MEFVILPIFLFIRQKRVEFIYYPNKVLRYTCMTLLVINVRLQTCYLLKGYLLFIQEMTLEETDEFIFRC